MQQPPRLWNHSVLLLLFGCLLSSSIFSNFFRPASSRTMPVARIVKGQLIVSYCLLPASGCFRAVSSRTVPVEQIVNNQGLIVIFFNRRFMSLPANLTNAPSSCKERSFVNFLCSFGFWPMLLRRFPICVNSLIWLQLSRCELAITLRCVIIAASIALHLHSTFTPLILVASASSNGRVQQAFNFRSHLELTKHCFCYCNYPPFAT